MASFQMNQETQTGSGLKHYKTRKLWLTLAAFTLLLCPWSFSHICPLLPWDRSSAPMLNITPNIRSTVPCMEARDPRSIPAHANSSTTSDSPPPPSLRSPSIPCSQIGLKELNILRRTHNVYTLWWQKYEPSETSPHLDPFVFGKGIKNGFTFTYNLT